MPTAGPVRENRVIEGVTVALTNLDKRLYPATGTTKGQVIDYFQAIAPFALPHLAGRPITRKRWPNGVDRPNFFEKRLPAHAPAWIDRGSQFHSDGESVYPIASSAATLVWLGQQAALELHVPQWAFVPGPDRPVPGPPDRMVLDLDPGPDVELDDCAAVALRIRELLTGMGLTAVPVTSGSKGLHVYSTLPEGVSSAGARTVARAIAAQLESETPDLVTASMAKDKRGGRVFLDWSQNSGSKTTIAPYSLRGRERPWAAAPRHWAELEEPGLTQLEFDRVLARAEADGDLLAPLLSARPAPAPFTTEPEATGPEATGPEATEPEAEPEPAPPPPISLAEHRHRRHRGAEPEPAAVAPMLPTEDAIGELRADRWAFEGKWDGYRIVATVRGGRVALRTRSGKSVTGDFPGFAALGAALGELDAVLDGEAVVLDADGVPAFHLMSAKARAKLLLFDVLELRGVDLTSRPWAVRRRVLEGLIPLLDPAGPVSVPDPIDAADGIAAIRYADARGWEGVVAKRRDSPYLPGERVRAWLKHKRWRDLQVVIGGWRPGTGNRADRIGSVLVGVPAATGLVYLGRVGSGFTDRELDDLAATLEPLRMRRSPFLDPPTGPDARGAVWVLPKVVGDVRYAALRAGGHLRQPTWRGFRPDLLPGDVPDAAELPWEGAEE